MRGEERQKSRKSVCFFYVVLDGRQKKNMGEGRVISHNTHTKKIVKLWETEQTLRKGGDNIYTPDSNFRCLEREAAIRPSFQSSSMCASSSEDGYRSGVSLSRKDEKVSVSLQPGADATTICRSYVSLTRNTDGCGVTALRLQHEGSHTVARVRACAIYLRGRGSRGGGGAVFIHTCASESLPMTRLNKSRTQP